MAQTGEPVLQAEEPDEEPIAIFYTEDHAEYARVDASADGWMPPALPSTEGEGQYLYWSGSYPTEDGVDYYYLDCIPGVGYPALPAKAEFQPISPQSTRGILFSNNGMQNWTDNNCFMMRYPSEDDTGEMKINGYQSSDRNGRSFLGWTLTPEPEGQTAVYLSGKFYGLANAGTTYMLPAAGNDNTIVTGWQEVTCDTENSSGQLPVTQTTDGGCQVDVPADAVQLYLTPAYQFVGIASIGDETCDFSNGQQYFRGTGWQLQSLYGGVQLRLNGYHGGAIDLPYTDLVTVTVSLFGDNAITGGDNGTALYCAGELRFKQHCEENRHSSLVVTAGSGQSAVSAKNLQLEPHLMLTGGESATALASGTELLPTGAYNLYDGSNIELTEGYTNTSSLKIEPIIITVTIDGGGGTTADGKATLVLETEYGIVPDVETLFHWNGHMHVGHGGKYSYDSETRKINGGTITLEWVEVEYEHFVGFNTVDAVLETPDYERYLFRDNSQTVIAPTITYTNTSKVLAYWQNTSSESEAYRQYLPGEQVTEPDGTKFYASTIQPDRQVLLIGNGKNFDSLGRSMRVSDGAYRLSAADGSQLLSWNTQADGKGTAYAPNTEIDLSGRTTPLVLYAQWKKPVYVATVETPKPEEPQAENTLTIRPRAAADPGTGTAPEPTEPEKPAPIKKTQKVLVGVYRWGMMIAVLQGETDEKGEEIYCTVPKGLDLTGCALKLFVLSEAYAPDRKVEFILLSE